MTKQIYITVGNRLTWGLDRSDLETDLEPVDDQGGEGLAVDVLRHDDQRALGLRKKTTCNKSKYLVGMRKFRDISQVSFPMSSGAKFSARKMI